MDSVSFGFLFWITMGVTGGIIVAAAIFMWIATIAGREMDRQTMAAWDKKATLYRQGANVLNDEQLRQLKAITSVNAAPKEQAR